MHMTINIVFNANYHTVDYHTRQRLAHHTEDASFARVTGHAATTRVAMSYTTAAYVVSMRDEQDDNAVYIPDEELPNTATVVALLVCVRRMSR
jgi:hypothetical protein